MPKTTGATPSIRLLAKILREVLDEGPFDTLADALDVWKFHLSRLRLNWTPDELNEALRLVGSKNRRV